MPTFARIPPTMSSFTPVDIPQSSTVGQQRQQISELQFDKFPTPSSFLCWKISFRNQVVTCSDFPRKRCYGSKRWRWSIQWMVFEMMDAKIVSALNKIIQNSHFKKKVSLEEQKVQKEDRFPRGRQIVFMIHDYFRVNGDHDTVLDYADLFSITLCNDDVQEFDTRWDELLLSMTKTPPEDILEKKYKLKIR